MSLIIYISQTWAEVSLLLHRFVYIWVDPQYYSYDSPKFSLSIPESFRYHFIMLLSASPMNTLEDPQVVLFCIHPTQMTASSSGDTLSASHASSWHELWKTWGCTGKVCLSPLPFMAISKPDSLSPPSHIRLLVLALQKFFPYKTGRSSFP